MQLPPSPARTTATEIEPDLLQPVICPLCHTAQSFSAPLDGGDWRCTRCGQQWDAARLATVAEYARAWAAEHGTGPRTA